MKNAPLVRIYTTTRKARPFLAVYRDPMQRQQLEQNDGAVARECGTSEGIIYRHYHRLVSLAEARKWAALRPKKRTGTVRKPAKDNDTAP